MSEKKKKNLLLINNTIYIPLLNITKYTKQQKK